MIFRHNIADMKLVAKVKDDAEIHALYRSKHGRYMAAILDSDNNIIERHNLSRYKARLFLIQHDYTCYERRFLK